MNLIYFISACSGILILEIVVLVDAVSDIILVIPPSACYLGQSVDELNDSWNLVVVLDYQSEVSIGSVRNLVPLL